MMDPWDEEVYLPHFTSINLSMVDFYGKLVGKYSINHQLLPTYLAIQNQPFMEVNVLPHPMDPSWS